MTTAFHRFSAGAMLAAGIASAVAAGLPSATYVSEQDLSQSNPPTATSQSVAIGMKNMGGSGGPDGAIVVHGPAKAK
ncbi:MAG TPA: hypothetical protein VL634_00655 [Mycobacterium sp.]|jgi:hypothetical protein|nr:hypothetical protein [Mycobacterium sp.]